MSYIPGYAPDANSQWRAMEPRFQELVLDELERLCLSPPNNVDYVSEVLLQEGSTRHFVFVHVTVDHARRKVTLVGVAHCTRPWPIVEA
jgi:hypothetical protein